MQPPALFTVQVPAGQKELLHIMSCFSLFSVTFCGDYKRCLIPVYMLFPFSAWKMLVTRWKSLSLVSTGFEQHQALGSSSAVLVRTRNVEIHGAYKQHSFSWTRAGCAGSWGAVPLADIRPSLQEHTFYQIRPHEFAFCAKSKHDQYSKTVRSAPIFLTSIIPIRWIWRELIFMLIS